MTVIFPPVVSSSPANSVNKKKMLKDVAGATFFGFIISIVIALLLNGFENEKRLFY